MTDTLTAWLDGLAALARVTDGDASPFRKVHLDPDTVHTLVAIAKAGMVLREACIRSAHVSNWRRCVLCEVNGTLPLAHDTGCPVAGFDDAALRDGPGKWAMSGDGVNFYDPRHPHEPAIPPVLDAEGHCLVCDLLCDLDAERAAHAETKEECVSLASRLTAVVEAARAVVNHPTEWHNMAGYAAAVERLAAALRAIGDLGVTHE